jgi:hypothetical protein
MPNVVFSEGERTKRRHETTLNSANKRCDGAIDEYYDSTTLERNLKHEDRDGSPLSTTRHGHASNLLMPLNVTLIFYPANEQQLPHAWVGTTMI